MNIVVLASHQLRHRYFISHLNTHFSLSAIMIEKFLYPPPYSFSKEEQLAWDWFFQRRKEYENKNMGTSDYLPAKNTPEVHRIPPGQLNSPGTIDRIKAINPDLIVLYGTSRVRSELLKRYPGRIFNLHVGLTEYCRGSSCNFWPIYNECLEFMGATIHKVDEGIDTGEILLRESIDLSEEEDEQSLAGKTVILGTALMVKTIQKWKEGSLTPIPQTEKGKQYFMREFTPKAVLRVKRMVESGQLQSLIRARKQG